jgi:hypothetical protein
MCGYCVIFILFANHTHTGGVHERSVEDVDRGRERAVPWAREVPRGETACHEASRPWQTLRLLQQSAVQVSKEMMREEDEYPQTNGCVAVK